MFTDLLWNLAFNFKKLIHMINMKKKISWHYGKKEIAFLSIIQQIFIDSNIIIEFIRVLMTTNAKFFIFYIKYVLFHPNNSYQFYKAWNKATSLMYIAKNHSISIVMNEILLSIHINHMQMQHISVSLECKRTLVKFHLLQ